MLLMSTVHVCMREDDPIALSLVTSNSSYTTAHSSARPCALIQYTTRFFCFGKSRELLSSLQLVQQTLELRNVFREAVGAAGRVRLLVERTVAHGPVAVVVREPFVELRNDRLRLKAEVCADHICPRIWRRLEVTEHLNAPVRTTCAAQNVKRGLTAVLTTMRLTFAESAK